jgi:hypothetical protein
VVERLLPKQNVVGSSPITRSFHLEILSILQLIPESLTINFLSQQKHLDTIKFATEIAVLSDTSQQLP